MGILKKLGTGQGFLKAGFLGFTASGKTTTAMKLAIGVRKFFGLKGPIGMFDTEGGSEYVEHWVKKEVPAGMVGVKGRSFSDLLEATREAESGKVSVWVVDSITHVWREVCQAYMKRLNEARKRNNKMPKSRMDLQDIMAVKEVWAEWPDLYLNSGLHLIVCGRAGFEWSMELNEETGKRELTKVGVKMKVENEFGFEPSLLVEMERLQEKDERTNATRIVHRATIIKDRFGIVDGRQADDPGFDFFKPHLELLRPGVHTPIDTEPKSKVPVDDDSWPKEKRERTILCEEIQGFILKLYPGQTTKEKSEKANLLEKVFGTRSWTKVESMQAKVLRSGLDRIRDDFGTPEPEGKEPKPEEATA